LPGSVPDAQPEEQKAQGDILSTVWEDQKRFYSPANLGMLGAALAAAAILAETDADRDVRDWYQNDMRGRDSDAFSDVAEYFGDGDVTIPVFIAAAGFGEIFCETEVGATVREWGERSLRTLITGGPLFLLMQRAIGSSRPEENDSSWHPFASWNGASGHSFLGAIPFITAAQMAENPFLKYSLYLFSTFAGYSRINDDDHYLSQAALGWWIAYLAASSVDSAKSDRTKVSVVPIAGGDGAGAALVIPF
jgi:hypothetical protein